MYAAVISMVIYICCNYITCFIWTMAHH